MAGRRGGLRAFGVEDAGDQRGRFIAAGDVLQLLAFGDDVRLIACDEHACRQQLRIVARGARLGIAAAVEEGDEIPAFERRHHSLGADFVGVAQRTNEINELCSL